MPSPVKCTDGCGREGTNILGTCEDGKVHVVCDPCKAENWHEVRIRDLVMEILRRAW